MPQLGSAPPGKLAPQLRPGLQSPDGEAQWGPGILGWPSLPCLTPWEVLDTTPPTDLKAQSSRFAPPGALRRVLVLLSPAMCLLCTFVGRVQMTGSLLGDKGH